MPVVKQLMASDTKIVDLSADFRMKSVTGYEKWYVPHTAPELCAQAVYGLPELYRTEISTAKLIANPGCYVTSVLLPLLPLLSAGLQPTQPLIIDSKSGVSGAGRNPGMKGFYAEANENFSAYKIGRQHRHIGEMEEQLSFAAGTPVNLIFTPHLLPINRGILSTIYLNFEQPVSPEQIQEILGKAYADEMFVRVMPTGETPCITQIRYSNRCDIGFVSLNGGHQLVLVSCLDNILKGASGQAVQNMNLLQALPETLGLPTEGAIT
ncbi:N-acetyl-gamma-glutamyl-phosphate reductase [bacterium]|nr:N-acetyl-gamma-glutamyl-phosphate reductase [bacterium]